jgi:hypothetical protein
MIRAVVLCRRVAVALLMLLVGCSRPPEPLRPVLESLGLPLTPRSVRFAVFGDTGTGGAAEFQVAETATRYRDAAFAFDFALLLGDNMYGAERPQDFEQKFTRPFRPLLERGVQFYAVLGNHDDRTERFFAPFHMDGHGYYAFSRGSVRFFALESDYMTPEQVAWLRDQLSSAPTGWKICFMHHPLYSSGRTHGPSLDLRRVLEPLFVEYGVNVVFAGHEHSYERFRPQNGVTYVVAGASAKLSRGNVRGSSITAASYDRDNSFMLVEIDERSLWFRTIARTGEVIDADVITRAGEPTAAASSRNPGRTAPSAMGGDGIREVPRLVRLAQSIAR